MNMNKEKDKLRPVFHTPIHTPDGRRLLMKIQGNAPLSKRVHR